MHNRRLIRSLADVPSVLPNVPSVIPDICNRESKAFSPDRAARMKGTKKKNTGFPLKTAGMTEREPAGMTKRARAGMPEESAGRHDYAFVIPNIVNRPLVIPDAVNRPSVILDIVNRPSVLPDICNRESKAFSPDRAARMKGTEKKNTGFPLKTGGHDRGGTGGHDRGGTGRHDREGTGGNPWRFPHVGTHK